MRKEFLKVYFELTTLGHWHYVKTTSGGRIIELKKEECLMYDIVLEEWIKIKSLSLVLNSNMTFCASGELSVFDCEVLENNKFKQSNERIKQ